uniref:Uncharacterized protein n=1 Tax=Steinernema glaseri TaxID=37863 RepID=A0A1I8AUY6_9BILA
MKIFCVFLLSVMLLVSSTTAQAPDSEFLMSSASGPDPQDSQFLDRAKRWGGWGRRGVWGRGR